MLLDASDLLSLLHEKMFSHCEHIKVRTAWETMVTQHNAPLHPEMKHETVAQKNKPYINSAEMPV